MNVGTIVAERPIVGGQVHWYDGSDQLMRVWTPLSDDGRCVRWDFHVAASCTWDPPQLNQIGIGPLRACKVFEITDGAYSWPGAAPYEQWTTNSATGYGTTFYRHMDTYNPVRVLRWTADQDYEAVLVRCARNATFVNINVTLTGTGTVVRPVLDTSSAASPWNGTTLADERYCVVATGVTTGSYLDFTPAAVGQCYLGPLIGVKTGDGDPATTDTLHLGPSCVYTGESARDARVVELCTWATTKGHHIGLLMHDAAHTAGPGGYMYSSAHSDANNKVEAAGGAAIPVVVTRIDAANPNGAVWAPAAGDRIETEVLTITDEGDARMYGAVMGTWRQWFRIDPHGFQHGWEIVWNAAAAAAGLHIAATGYADHFTLNSAPGWVESPGALAPTALNLDDDSTTPIIRGNRFLFTRGTLNDAIVEYSATRTPLNPTGQLSIKQFIAGTNKIMSQTGPAGTADINVTDGMVTTGGGTISIYRAPAHRRGRIIT